jgi:hypothetical protein
VSAIRPAFLPVCSRSAICCEAKGGWRQAAVHMLHRHHDEPRLPQENGPGNKRSQGDELGVVEVVPR